MERKEPFFKWILTKEFIQHTFTYEMLLGLPYEDKMKKARVDFVYLNNENKTHVFEIKTSHDSFARLERQLGFYCQAFDFVSVVLDAIDTKKISKLKKMEIPENVGIFVIDGEELKQIKKPEQNKINLDFVYDILYVGELKQADDTVRMDNRDEKKCEFMQKNDIEKLFKKVRFDAHRNRADFIRRRFSELKIQDLKKIKKSITDHEFDYKKRAGSF